MNIADLINLLEEYDWALPVFIEDGEWGATPILNVRLTSEYLQAAEGERTERGDRLSQTMWVLIERDSGRTP